MIAYFILVHRFPEQFKRLFRAISDPANHYLVRIDRNSGSELDQAIRTFLDGFPNSAVLESRSALWGGYSLVDAQLRGMAKLLETGADWEFFVNRSGQDYPLRSQAEIADVLSRHRGQEFNKVLDQAVLRPDTMPRVGRYVVEFGRRILQTPVSRRFLAGASPSIGNQWMIVSRRFCDVVCHDGQAARFKAFYKNTGIADEGFFETMMMMSTASHGEIVSDDLCMSDWVPDGDIKPRPRTFTIEDGPALLASDCLFARKFDATVDEDMLDPIDIRLARPLPSRAPIRKRGTPLAEPMEALAS